MTNGISELIGNTVQTNTEKTKNNQYQTKDNGQSFNDILNKFNDRSSNLESNKSAKVNNSPTKNNQKDPSNSNKTVDNSNLKKDMNTVNKTDDKVKSRDVHNDDASKDVSNRREEKSKTDSAIDHRKTGVSHTKDKTDSVQKSKTDSNLDLRDDNNIKSKDQTFKDNSVSKDENIAEDDSLSQDDSRNKGETSSNKDQSSTSDNFSGNKDDKSQTDISSSDIQTETKNADNSAEALQATTDSGVDASIQTASIQNQDATAQTQAQSATAQVQSSTAPTQAPTQITNSAQAQSQDGSVPSSGLSNNALTDKSTSSIAGAAADIALSLDITQSDPKTDNTQTNNTTTANTTTDNTTTDNNDKTLKGLENVKQSNDPQLDLLAKLNINNNCSGNSDSTTAATDSNPLTQELINMKNTSTDQVQDQTQIKVSNDVKVSTDKKVDDKDLNELLNKTPLEQAVASELDAEVTSSSQSSSDSFSKHPQQNASEQVVKLSIEPLVKTDNLDFTNVISQDKMISSQDKAQLNAAQAPIRTLNQLDIMNQITDKMSTFKSNTTDKIEIILKPENLGKVNVEIQSVKGAITATLIAENQQVKEILEKNIDSLRNNLNSQGVNLNNLNVKVEESDKSAFNSFNFDQKQFDSEAGQQQQKPQSTYKTEYKGTAETDIIRGTEESAISSGELRHNDSLHVGMVDYKV